MKRRNNIWTTIVLLTVVLLVGCSQDDVLVTEQQGAKANGDAIVLGVKEVKSQVTRAQHTDIMDFKQLETTGFGVYGYEGTDAYNSSSSEFELFAPNTQVTFEEDGTEPTTSLDIPGSWKYTETSEGLKEWDKTKKYTFFAYAPYMISGEGTYGTNAGINTISTGSGDPTISYTVATDPAESVDLLWGVRTDTQKKSGLPWIDIQQGQTTSAVLFTFYHALCALGLHAQVIVDQHNRLSELDDESNIGTIGSADGCKVTLKSITIEPAGTTTPATSPVDFHQSGVLNLNNTTAHQPKWQSTSGSIASLVLNSSTTVNNELLDPHPTEVDNTTGYEIMTSASYDTEVPGITQSSNSQPIIKDDKLFMLIPQAAQDYTISVEYFLTYKTGDSTYHRELVTRDVTLSNLELVAGVKYYINLVIGLRTFKVNISAMDWEEEPNFPTIASENGTSAGHSLAK